MGIVVVPDTLSAAINAELDEAFKDVPDAEQYRDIFYHELLRYFDEHGIIPDFKLTTNPDQPAPEEE